MSSAAETRTVPGVMASASLETRGGRDTRPGRAGTRANAYARTTNPAVRTVSTIEVFGFGFNLLGTESSGWPGPRSEEHTSELQSLRHLVCRLLLEKKRKQAKTPGDDGRSSAERYATQRDLVA